MVGSGGNESIFESFRTSDEVRNGDVGRCQFQTDTFTQAPIQHNLNKVGIPFFWGCQWPSKTSFQHLLLNLVATMARSIWPWRFQDGTVAWQKHLPQQLNSKLFTPLGSPLLTSMVHGAFHESKKEFREASAELRV